MNLSNLSGAELTKKLEVLCAAERNITLEVLYHLIEVDKRKLYCECGYSSLFDFCVRKLKYSESGAGRRVAAARCLRDHPELSVLLLEGTVSLGSICAAAGSINNGKISCESIAEKSEREVKAIVAPHVPKKPAERVRPVVVESVETPLIPQPPAEERYEIRFSLTKEMYEAFEEAKNRLSNSLGKDLSVEAVIGKLVENYLKEKTSKAAKAPKGRYIPASIKREVLKRDNCRCTYAGPDGTRCNARKYLQYDHVLPVALGGKSEVSNLRLLCSLHNRFEAIRILGPQISDGYSQR